MNVDLGPGLVLRQKLIGSDDASHLGNSVRCPGCGREVGEASYCEYCGAYLATPAVVSSPAVAQTEKTMPSQLYIVIIGIAVIIVGGVIYAVAWTDTMNDFWDDPFADDSSFDSMFDLMMASYIIMSIGTVTLFIGLILLVINE
jgi:hypothetical protein